MASYRALVGIDYPPNKRAEVGDVIDDLPGKSIKWLLDGGYIEPSSNTPSAPVVEETPAEESAPIADEAPADAPAPEEGATN